MKLLHLGESSIAEDSMKYYFTPQYLEIDQTAENPHASVEYFFC